MSDFQTEPVIGVGAAVQCILGKDQDEVLAALDNPVKLFVKLAGTHRFQIQKYGISGRLQFFADEARRFKGFASVAYKNIVTHM